VEDSLGQPGVLQELAPLLDHIRCVFLVRHAVLCKPDAARRDQGAQLELSQQVALIPALGERRSLRSDVLWKRLQILGAERSRVR
jgi:hypothetical protein